MIRMVSDMDMAYLNKWLSELGLTEMFDKARRPKS